MYIREYPQCCVAVHATQVLFTSTTGVVLAAFTRLTDQKGKLFNEKECDLNLVYIKNIGTYGLAPIINICANIDGTSSDVDQLLEDYGFYDLDVYPKHDKYISPYSNTSYMSVVFKEDKATFVFYVNEAPLFKYDCINGVDGVYTKYTQIAEDIRGYFAYVFDIPVMCSPAKTVEYLHNIVLESNYEMVEGGSR